MQIEALVEQITNQIMQQLTNKEMLKEVKPQTSGNVTYKEGSSSNIITGPSVARMIDHTLLKPEASKDQIVKLCEEAKEHKFATVCMNPYWVATAAKELKGSGVGITTVVGFPLGATSTFVKSAETRDAIANGATEIDMVMNIGALKTGDFETVKKDIEGVVLAANGHAPVKVIIETGLLEIEEKKKACILAKMAGAAFVKTSTGFGPGCATAEDIKLMREAVGPDMGVKASACVRDLDTARKLIQAGATRIGASSSIAIITGGQGTGY
jgi:deoxyribose-phosphate aldolase